MDKIIQIWNKTNRWHRTIFIFLMVELRVLPKQQLGFECNDPALSHPYTGDTISWKWLLTSVAFLPLVVLLITERIYNTDNSKERSKKQALRWYKEYLFGTLINLTVVQTLKILVGAPRPHFFDTCSPTEASTCSGSEYISSYTCDKGHWVNQSDTSFPSGHASLAVHTGVFIAYYLHQRTKGQPSNVVLAVQVLTIIASIYCSISRITDRRHHWWDVLVGAILAVPITVYTITMLCKNFKCPPLKPESGEQGNSVEESSSSNGFKS